MEYFNSKPATLNIQHLLKKIWKTIQVHKTKYKDKSAKLLVPNIISLKENVLNKKWRLYKVLYIKKAPLQFYYKNDDYIEK